MSLRTFDLLRVLNRSFYVQSTWNSERMMSLGYCFCLVPFIRKTFRKSSERAEFLSHNSSFFNTHPYMANIVIGAVMKMEEGRLDKNNLDTEKIGRVKKRLSESFAAIGDKLFWAELKPIAAILGVCTAFFTQTFAPVIFLLFYNLPHLYFRISGLFKGYNLGFDLVTQGTLTKYRRIANQLNNVGAFATGVLIVVASHVKNVLFPELISFLAAALLMIVLLRFKLSVPLALTLLLLISTVVSGLM